MKNHEELSEMSRDDLITYAKDRQDAAYSAWEQMMGRDL